MALSAASACPPFGGHAPAGFWRRFGAGLFDSLLVVFLWDLSAMWVSIVVWWLRGLPSSLDELLILLAVVLLLGVGLRVVYTVIWVGGCGQTPGRMATGIAIVDRSGGTPGYGRAFVRWLGGIVNVLTLGLPALVLLFSRDGRGVPDRLAGTREVLRPRATLLNERRL